MALRGTIASTKRNGYVLKLDVQILLLKHASSSAELFEIRKAQHNTIKAERNSKPLLCLTKDVVEF